MSGLWSIIVPESATNSVLNPSAEAADNFGGLFVGSPSISSSPSASASPSASQSASPSASASPSGSQSKSPSASASPSASVSPTPSGSASPSTSVSPSPSPSFGVAAVSRVTTYARFGDYCYFVQTSKPYDGMWLGLATLTNAAHYVSLYLYEGATGVSGSLTAPEVALDGHTFSAMSVIGGRAGSWVRYGVSIPAAQANGSQRLDIRMPTEADFYVDAVNVTPTSYATTYIDGDRGEHYRWSGLRHASASTRSAQERRGGRERNLLDDYSIEVVEGTKRIGMPPIIHSLQSQSLLPGARYQGVKVLPREIELNVHYTVDDAGSDAATWEAFSAKRAQLIDLLKPDRTRSGPIVIGYAGQGSDEKLYAEFYYNGGLEAFSDLLHVDEVTPVRLLAPDPFWYADDQETASLDYTDSLATALAFRRHDGQWKALGTGFDTGVVNAIAVDKVRGRIYFGGTFNTANGRTVNRICYWDGSDFIAMGATPGTAGGSSVIAIAVAPNGDVWVGGNFTSAGGSTADGLARWNISTSTWTGFTNGTPGDIIRAIAIDSSGNVYIGGTFTNWDGNANEDYIIKYNGSAFSALGTGMNNTVFALAIFSDDKIYVGGSFTTGNSVTLNGIGYWNGTTFVAMGATAGLSGGAASTYAIEINRNGDVAVGGDFTAAGGVSAAMIAIFNGATFLALSSGLNGTVQTLKYLPDGLLLISGAFTAAGDLTVDSLAYWNGYTFVSPDIKLANSPSTQAMGEFQDDLFIGLNASATATASGLTTATNGGSTAIYPRLTIINGNSSGSCTLQWFENQSDDHRMYFNLAIQAGEKVELDLSGSQKRLVSDWRGVITNNPLKNSDVTNWKLLPGANIIAAFITGTVTSVTALLHWTPRFWSADGAA